MPQWSIEVISDRKLDPDTMVIFSMIPMEEERNAIHGETDFWEEVKRVVSAKTRLYNMPSGVVEAYIRDARKNPGNRIALLLKY